MHVLDCATLEPDRDPLSDLEVIEVELRTYAGDLSIEGGRVPLLERPQIVVLNKIDVPEARDLAELVKPDLEARGFRVFEVSTASHEGLRPLTFALGEIVDKARRDAPAPENTRVVLRPKAVDDAGFTVTRREVEGQGVYFWVRGEKPERWVRQTDFSNDEAVGYLADRLARLGVEEKLFAAGAVAGRRGAHRSGAQRGRLRLGAHAHDRVRVPRRSARRRPAARGPLAPDARREAPGVQGAHGRQDGGARGAVDRARGRRLDRRGGELTSGHRICA